MYKTGFVGQDVMNVLPEMVRYEESEDEYGVSNLALVPILTKSIQEQQLIIEDQNKKIESQDEKIQKLEEQIEELREEEIENLQESLEVTEEENHPKFNL